MVVKMAVKTQCFASPENPKSEIRNLK